VLRLFILAAGLASVFYSHNASAQAKDTTTDKNVPSLKQRRQDLGIVKAMAVMPYATVSYNLQSGQAFPKSANGVGYGFGVAFDFAPDKQPIGFYLDFAYQDMRASSKDGACKIEDPANPKDTVAITVPVTHYFSYALVEAFLKLQSAKSNGYFLIGFSAGISTTALTDLQGPGVDQFEDWNTVGTYNKVRFDIRGGLGLKLATIDTHDLMLEARFGYPLTNILSDYSDICNGNGARGSWRAVSLQANLGLRL
jgi:hypothetical protein